MLRSLPSLGCLAVIALTALAPETKPADKKHLLVIGQSGDFTHESISYGMITLGKIGAQSGVFDVTLRTDGELITKGLVKRGAKNLSYYDAVFFYTSGELPWSAAQKADLLAFIHDGKGFLGVHSATDTFYEWPEFGDMIGAYFDMHPWNQDVRINVEDRDFPATRHLPRSFAIADEIYQFKDFSRDRVRVLMSIDPASVDLTKKDVHRSDRDFPVAWARRYGKGRVFYCSLGHRPEVWDRADIQKMWLEAIRWTLGLIEGDATPRPKKGD